MTSPTRSHTDEDPADAVPSGPAASQAPSAASRLAGHLVGLPRPAQVLAVWAACSTLTFLVLRLSAQDTPATAWAGAAPGWQEHMSFWDAGWYERIAREGYPRRLPVDAQGDVTQNTWAFMPLLPTLAHGLTWVTGWSFYTCAALISIVASAAAALAMDWWLSPRTGSRASLWAVALLWGSPCAPVLQVPYAEALTLLTVSLALGLTDRGRPLAAAPFTVLAAFSRPVGVPLGAALGLWWAWQEACSHGWIPRRSLSLPVGGPSDESPSRHSLLALSLLSCAASLAWPALAWASTGRADAYTATETAWRGGDLVPFTPWLTRSGWWVGHHLSWLLLLLVLAGAVLLLTAPALRRLGAAAWFWCLGYILYLLAFFDPTSSVLRILLPLAPVAWSLARRARTTRARAALLLAGLVGQLFWVSWVWALGSVEIQWVP
ncbi:hypothetical protein [Actinomyces lilanjuaniae]|uniref:hypothetical protein n=1 Tax=Actinomyces lilanjuaniae TaxID=2321394 RepID=UPI003C12BB1D